MQDKLVCSNIVQIRRIPLYISAGAAKEVKMIEVMKTLQRYVPPTGEESKQKTHQIIFGGDQLTAARAGRFMQR